VVDEMAAPPVGEWPLWSEQEDRGVALCASTEQFFDPR
jgi:hypothetical protein